jgi:hypothetical protein
MLTVDHELKLLAYELETRMAYPNDLELIHRAAALLSAMLDAQVRADVGAGWVLVPAEPMPEMVAAWWRVKNTGSTEPGETGEDRSDCAAYRAMIAAAPQPPANVGA